MHTILGAGGPVANALTRELLNNSLPVRLCSRRKPASFSEPEWIKTDLKDRKEVLKAVAGSEIIYITAGLVYDKKVWAQEWPVITQNIIDAAKETNARLIFFDNVYCYGRVNGKMTEDTPYNPSSVKGQIRAEVATRLMNESGKGNINATIARAADFYGSDSMNSFFDSMVMQKYAKGEKAMWLGNVKNLHSFTYVPDAGKTMYLLGQEPKSGNQIWHVPTAPAITGIEMIGLAAKAMGVPPKYMSVNKFMLQALGLFQPLIRESVELYYQYQYDYQFDSAKFENSFGLKPTGYAAGITEFSKTLRAKINPAAVSV